MVNNSLKKLIVLSLQFSTLLHAKVFQSGEVQVHLLELYSSQGCSSCPPADRWLNDLKNNGGLWKNFIPVAFHVDYWDYLGWKDPYSQSTFSNRQRLIAASWKNGSVYTPGVVLDGKEWRNWGNISELNVSAKVVGVLTATHEDGTFNFSVEYAPSKNLKFSKWVLHGALMGNNIKTQILSGENGGKQLEHEFVALDFKQVIMDKMRETYIASINFSSPLKQNAKSLSAVFWVSEENTSAPIQAVGGNFAKLK